MSEEKCSWIYRWWEFTHNIYYKLCPGSEDHNLKCRVGFFVWGSIWRFGVGFGGIALTGVLFVAIFYDPFAINFHMTYIANALSVFDPITMSLTILVGLGMLTISLHSAIKSIYRCIALCTKSIKEIDEYCVGNNDGYYVGLDGEYISVAEYQCQCRGDRVAAYFYECRPTKKEEPKGDDHPLTYSW